MKQLIKILTLLLLLAVAGGHVGYAMNDTIIVRNSTDTTVCESYEWYGTLYTQTDVYTYMSDDSTVIDTLHLTVNPLPVIYISANADTVCESGMIWVSNVNPSYDYQWSDSTTNTWTSVDSSGTYYVTATDTNGCSNTASKTIIVNQPYYTTIDTSICQGEFVLFFDEQKTATGVYTRTVKAVNGCDSTVTLTLVVNPTYNTPITATICQGESYLFNGRRLVAAGIYYDTLLAVSGCDSIISLTLVVNQTYDTTLTAAICQGESYSFLGKLLTERGTYHDTLHSINGCDSVLTLILTVNPLPIVTITGANSFCQGTSTTLTAAGASTYMWSNGSTTNETTVNYAGFYMVTATGANGCKNTDSLLVTEIPTQTSSISVIGCEEYTWNDTVYYTSGDYTQTLTAANGCDSIVTLHLTIHHGTHNVFIVDTCESYTWHGQTYTASGNYTYPYNNEYGCSSVDTLYLTINNPIHTAITRSACGGYEWHDSTYTESGDYFFSHSDVNGCTQVDTLHLTINNPIHAVTTVAACESYTWNSTLYTESGDYTYAHTDAHGCWQVDTLHVTINHATYGDTTVVACETFAWHGTTYTETPAIAPTYTIVGGNHNGCDSIVTLHLTIHHGTHNVFTETACESYTWHGQTYTASGTYTYPYNNEYGCSSVDTLYLTINNPVHTAITRSACGGYEWHETTYTESGDYFFSHPDANGCTQVDTLHLTINNPVHSATTVTACESYTWNGTLYTESGNYTYVHTDAHDCWQVDTLHLTINSAYHTDLHVSSCETYTWDGQTYTESGDYDQTFTAASGCDSIVTLHLTIHHGTHNVFTETACESYSWHGQTYTASGTYTYPYNNEYDCPSVDTLKLTINYGTHNVFTKTACESYTWHGETYTTSGTYTYLYTTADGCASADTLHLTIHTPVHTATTVTICNSYTWTEGTGMTYTTSGTYTYAHPDANGCTQVDTLHLIILSSVYTEVSVTECGNYYWNDNNYTTSGDYTGIFSAAIGCDSIVTLHLTIIPALQDIKNIVSKKRDGIPYMLVYPDANLQYQWYKNGVAINNATKQYYYPADYELESSLEMDACYQVLVAAKEPGTCGTYTDCWVDVPSQSAKIRILPNPNDGQFRLILPEGTVEVQILNANGQVVMSRKVDGDNMLDMSMALANGLYFVKSFRHDGSFDTEKLIINR